MKAKASVILTIIVLAFCSGCGTVSTGFERNPYPVYGGVRQDAHIIGGGGAGPIFIIDVPFSFAADTLLLPLGLYDLTLLPPAVDPLKDWKSISSQPDNAITVDYQNYLQKHQPGYFVMDGVSFYEDGTGQHAVKITVGREGYYTVYIFIYDKSNVRTKIIRWANGGYAC